MNIIDHGSWVLYTPALGKRPDDAPLSAMFARRESDQVDWYEYVKDPASFQTGTVKFAAVYRDYAGGYVVGPAVYAADRIFPAGHIVGEITDYAGSDPQADLGNKVYDPATATFSEMPPIPAPELEPNKIERQILATLASLIERLDKLEQHKER